MDEDNNTTDSYEDAVDSGITDTMDSDPSDDDNNEDE